MVNGYLIDNLTARVKFDILTRRDIGYISAALNSKNATLMSPIFMPNKIRYCAAFKTIPKDTLASW